MNSQQMPSIRQRTAVLVVHGMGLQRPLDTTRGIMKALWLTGDPQDKNNKIWMHPERSPIDIDLPVITTSAVPGPKSPRSVDFHELYWSHLMSETRGIAVLLWLFELAHKGPRLTPNMKLLWWGAALFLELMILSTALLVTKLIERFADVSALQESILIAPVLMFLILGVVGCIVFSLYRAWSFALWSAILAVALAIVLSIDPAQTGILVSKTLPMLAALIATLLLMGKWGLGVFVFAYGLSFLFEILVRIRQGVLASTAVIDLLPWAMNSPWCIVAACVILATYLVINAVFLQPYLGDAARYFRNAPSNVAVRREIRRQAVSTLEGLHLSGRYDRIVVVAHSLGTVIAYDMLRAYFGRVARSLPTEGKILTKKINEVESGKLNLEQMRAHGRQIIAEIAQIAENEQAAKQTMSTGDSDDGRKVWLVTDFITMGSPLTHAHYLMSRGRTADELSTDFKRRIKEREFPVCPPERIDKDGYLTFTHELKPTRWFHNGALFGLTRWTNLYFPVSELFRGDAIGGQLNEIFGEGIFDVPVNTASSRGNGLFAHVTYWDVPESEPLNAPHIQALRNAIDLADSGVVNERRNFPQSHNLTKAGEASRDFCSHREVGSFMEVGSSDRG
jgi:hypothetical protein